MLFVKKTQDINKGRGNNKLKIKNEKFLANEPEEAEDLS